MSRRIAVLGTGTGVGKSHVTVGWTRHLLARGLTVRAWKPIETGGFADADALIAASGAGGRDDTRVFPTPASPHRSARIAGAAIDLRERAVICDRIDFGLDALLIEGAGGAFSPLVNASVTVVDLMVALRASAAVLVVADRLGALHDTIAVVRAIGDSLALRAIVLNAHGASLDVAALDNAGELRSLFPGLLVAQLASVGTADFDALTNACFT